MGVGGGGGVVRVLRLSERGCGARACDGFGLKGEGGVVKGEDGEVFAVPEVAPFVGVLRHG